MIKFISLLLTFCFMGSLAVASAAGETVVYESAFAAGDDDWFARGAQKVYHTTDATLRTEGRTADWNSPGRYFELVPGNEYTVSVDILQNDTDSAHFLISMEHTDGNGTGWDRLVPGNVKKGEWTTLSGKFTPAEYDSYVLYVETDGSPEISYEIRDFRLESPNGIPEARTTEAPAVVPEATDIPSLKDVYAGKFDFGAAAPQNAFMNPKLMELMKEQFSILTPENELKPDSVLNVSASQKLVKETGDETSVAVHFDAAKALLQFAQSNGIKVHGHVLVWHSQTPEAFFHEGYDSGKPLVSREIMLGRLENYIREVLTQTEELYPGVIVSWDVVNEAIDDGTNWIRKESKWTQVIGEDFVTYAFEYARKFAKEGVLLYYNDYNSAYAGKLNGIIKMIQPLIEAGTIDGYGFQMHHTTGQPSNEQMTAAVEKIAALGIKMRVSELDVGVTKYTETSLQAQADKYRAMMELMLRFADQTEAVQVWGLTDNMSWRSQSCPLLFDSKMNPKPAFYAVIEAAGEPEPVFEELAGKTSDEYEPLYSFAEAYGFRLGGCFGIFDMGNKTYMDFLNDHFNSLTCTNETKAYSLLDQSACKRSEDGMPRMNYTNADKMIAWCQEHGKAVRGHVLVWDAVMQYPWFFHEDYDEKKPFADPEVNRKRLASYIDQVISHFEEKFPGVIYCWDVVNEAIGDNASDWRSDDPRHIRIVRDGGPNFFQAYVGDDYVEYAFLCARNTVDRLGTDIHLFYNDYNMFMSEKRMAALALLKSINSYATDENGEPRKLADGIGMQGYLGGYGVQEGCLEDSLITDLKESIAMYHEAGLEVQMTEMAVRNFDRSKAELHADFYGRLFSEVFMPANETDRETLSAVCIWGLVDAPEGKKDYVYKMNSPYGCFLNTKYEIKTCFDRVYHVLKGE